MIHFEHVFLVLCVSGLTASQDLAPSTTTTVVYVGPCPVVLNGACPDQQYITFNLFTRMSQETSEIITLSPDNLDMTNFVATKPTKIIIHGFNDNSTDINLINIKNQLLTKGDYNVILVDYGILAIAGDGTCYPTATQNVKHVGACVAGLIQKLRDSSAVDIHVIGHSLGAQMTNYIANNLKPYILPKITGLDPAWPLYQLASNDEKLDASDAVFVEVLHTNVNAYGTPDISGHVDYFFNDGTKQPGCGMLQEPSCSHSRSTMYYAESINSATGFYGWQCSSVAQYYLNLCLTKPRAILVGDINTSESTSGVVSVPTASSSPFALGM